MAKTTVDLLRALKELDQQLDNGVAICIYQDGSYRLLDSTGEVLLDTDSMDENLTVHDFPYEQPQFMQACISVYQKKEQALEEPTASAQQGEQDDDLADVVQPVEGKVKWV